MPTILVTGCQGKVGSTVAAHFAREGFDVVGVDLLRGVYDTPTPGDGFPATYIQADLEDAGACFALVARFKPAAIVHVAAIPDPCHNPPHVVFRTNVMATFNCVEAAQKLGVPRFVFVSSEHVPGFFSSPGCDPWGSTRAAGEAGLPAYAPVDEAHPIAPQNPVRGFPPRRVAGGLPLTRTTQHPLRSTRCQSPLASSCATPRCGARARR